jgi:hypothetical protein
MLQMQAQLNKQLLSLLLQLKRYASKKELSGGESKFDLEEIDKIYNDPTASTSSKVVVITANLYKAMPFFAQGIINLQQKISVSLTEVSQLQHLYERLHATKEGLDRKVLEESINISVSKLDLHIIDLRDNCKRLVEDLKDGYQILTILESFENIAKAFKDFKFTYMELSTRTLTTYDILLKTNLLELKLTV